MNFRSKWNLKHMAFAINNVIFSIDYLANSALWFKMKKKANLFDLFENWNPAISTIPTCSRLCATPSDNFLDFWQHGNILEKICFLDPSATPRNDSFYKTWIFAGFSSSIYDFLYLVRKVLNWRFMIWVQLIKISCWKKIFGTNKISIFGQTSN